MASDSHWSSSLAIPVATGDCCEPAVAAIGETVHIAWTQERTLHHAFLVDGKWSEVRAIGFGGQACLVGAPDGRLHCLFSARLFENTEIYHAVWDDEQWTPPQVVSGTSGVSIYPALAIAPDGILYAAWADATPGYSTIYHGHQDGELWTSAPVPNASGTRPAIAVGKDYQVYVAWQNRMPDTLRYEVFCAIYAGAQWTLPYNVSASADRHSIYPHLVTNSRGACHILWQEDHGDVFAIQHADRRPNEWSMPDDASQSSNDCRLPRALANRQGHIQALWSEGQALCHRVRPAAYDALWWKPEVGCEECGGVSEVAAALSAKGYLYVVWAGYKDGDTRRLYYVRREPVFAFTTFVPAVSSEPAEAEAPEA